MFPNDLESQFVQSKGPEGATPQSCPGDKVIWFFSVDGPDRNGVTKKYGVEPIPHQHGWYIAEWHAIIEETGKSDAVVGRVSSFTREYGPSMNGVFEELRKAGWNPTEYDFESFKKVAHVLALSRLDTDYLLFENGYEFEYEWQDYELGPFDPEYQGRENNHG